MTPKPTDTRPIAAWRLVASSAMLWAALGLPSCVLDGFEVDGAGGQAAAGNGASASTASDGGAGTGATGGTGAGAGGGESDCTNGNDDDGDSAVDCADEDCADHICVPAAPAGWSGPVALYEGRGPATCPAPWSTPGPSGNGFLSAPPANCNACQCGGATGVQCGTATIELWGNGLALCIGMADVVQTASTSCASVRVEPPVSAKASSIGVTGGSCAPMGGGVSDLPPFEEGLASVCDGAALGGGCGTGKCAPVPAAGLLTTLCVYKDGDVACEGEYSDAHVIHTGGVMDHRDCSACGCAAPTGICVGDVDLYTGFCATQVANVPADNTCIEGVADITSVKVSINAGPTATCATTGGMPIGNITGNDPVTVCCLP